jgi:short-subunit dehydrogenase
VLLARREDRLRALAADLGGEAEPCDLSERTELEATARRIAERHPALHLLVNNAGIPARGTVLDVSPELVERVLAVNHLAGVRLTRLLLPCLRAAPHGRAHVVNVASVAGTVAFAQAGAYAASKHAQVAFSRALRTTLAPEGIHVHTVLPGFVATEGFRQAALLAHPVLRRIVVEPDRVARAIVGAVERGRPEVVVPWLPYRLAPVVQGLAPGIAARLARRTIGRARPL